MGMIDAVDDKVRELEQENERLRGVLEEIFCQGRTGEDADVMAEIAKDALRDK